MNSYYVTGAGQFSGVSNANISIAAYIEKWEENPDSALEEASKSAYEAAVERAEGMADKFEVSGQINILDVERLDALKGMDPMSYVATAGIRNIDGMDTIKKEAVSWYGLMKTIGFLGLVISIMTAVLKLVMVPRRKGEIMETVGIKLIAAAFLFGTAGLFGLLVSLIQEFMG